MPAGAVARKKRVADVHAVFIGVFVNEIYSLEDFRDGNGKGYLREKAVRKTHDRKTSFRKRGAICRVEIFVSVHPAAAVYVDNNGQFLIFRTFGAVKIHKMTLLTVAEIIDVGNYAYALCLRKRRHSFRVVFRHYRIPPPVKKFQFEFHNFPPAISLIRFCIASLSLNAVTSYASCPSPYGSGISPPPVRESKVKTFS